MVIERVPCTEPDHEASRFQVVVGEEGITVRHIFRQL